MSNKVAETLAFFATVIMSGEPWTVGCQKALDEAMAELNLGQSEASQYPRGSHWAIDIAYQMFDLIRPGAVPDDVRFFIIGWMGGALLKNRLRIVDEPELIRQVMAATNNQFDKDAVTQVVRSTLMHMDIK